MRLRKIATTLVVGLMLFQLAAAPAAATNTLANDDPCKTDAVDVVKYALTLGGAGAYDAGKCKVNQQKTDEARSAVTMEAFAVHDMSEVSTVMADNQAESFESALWCRAEAEIVSEYESGATAAEARENVSELVYDRAAAAQINVLRSWNTSLSLAAHAFQYGQDNGLQSQGNAVLLGTDSDQNKMYLDEYESKSSKTYSLANGTQQPYQSVLFRGHDSSGNSDYFTLEFGWPREVKMFVNPTDGNLGTLTGSEEIFSYMDYKNSLNELGAVADNVAVNANKTINSTWENGTSVDSEDLLSACSAETMSTDDGSTGQYANYRWAMMLAGEPTDVNSSFTIEWDPAEGVTVPGDTTVEFVTENGARISNLSLGSDAIVTGSESIRYDVSGVNVSSTQVVITNESGGTVSVNASPVGGGEYLAPVPGQTLNTYATPNNLSVSIRVTDSNGTEVQTESIAWTLDPNGTETVTLSGGLNTNWAPAKTNGTYQTDVWYDTANRSDPIYFVADQIDGTKLYQLESGQFRIVDMRNAKTGESVNQTTLDDDAYQTVDTQINETVVNKTINYYQTNDENFDPKIGGSGGGLFSGGLGGLGAISAPLVLLAGGALLLLSRD